MPSQAPAGTPGPGVPPAPDCPPGSGSSGPSALAASIREPLIRHPQQNASAACTACTARRIIQRERDAAHTRLWEISSGQQLHPAGTSGSGRPPPGAWSRRGIRCPVRDFRGDHSHERETHHGTARVDHSRTPAPGRADPQEPAEAGRLSPQTAFKEPPPSGTSLQQSNPPARLARPLSAPPGGHAPVGRAQAAPTRPRHRYRHRTSRFRYSCHERGQAAHRSRVSTRHSRRYRDPRIPACRMVAGMRVLRSDWCATEHRPHPSTQRRRVQPHLKSDSGLRQLQSGQGRPPGGGLPRGQTGPSDPHQRQSRGASAGRGRHEHHPPAAHRRSQPTRSCACLVGRPYQVEPHSRRAAQEPHSRRTRRRLPRPREGRHDCARADVRAGRQGNGARNVRPHHSGPFRFPPPAQNPYQTPSRLRIRRPRASGGSERQVGGRMGRTYRRSCQWAAPPQRSDGRFQRLAQTPSPSAERRRLRLVHQG